MAWSFIFEFIVFEPFIVWVDICLVQRGRHWVGIVHIVEKCRSLDPCVKGFQVLDLIAHVLCLCRCETEIEAFG